MFSQKFSFAIRSRCKSRFELMNVVFFKSSATITDSKVSRKRISEASQFHTCSVPFAGHSKWQNIRHIKAQKDGERSLQFVRLARQIRVAIQGNYLFTIHSKLHILQ